MMVRIANNNLLHKAKKNKRDEFYTQFSDIEHELQYYPDCFEGKVVYCNCDDPHISNFFLYFKRNFKILGLRKLIASCYRESVNDLFGQCNDAQAYYCEYDGLEESPKIVPLKGDGDFRSPECELFLQQSDIVVTNPPFSLFREFVSLLVKHNKKFLIIGNVNVITYKEIFGLIQKNKAWLGVNLGRGISGFIVPEHYQQYGTEVSFNAEGKPIIATNDCLWLTNLELNRRHEDIYLTKEYLGNEDKYPMYDNCEGINIDRTQDIPKDYSGLMGVPITFLHKYNPEQFEIIRFRKGDNGKDLCINGKCPYFRILIKNRRLQK